MSLRSSVPWRAFGKSWVHPYCCLFMEPVPVCPSPSGLACPPADRPLQSFPQLARPPVCPSPAGHPPPARPQAGLSLAPALEWRRGSLGLGSRGLSFLLGSLTRTPVMSPGPGPVLWCLLSTTSAVAQWNFKGKWWFEVPFVFKICIYTEDLDNPALSGVSTREVLTVRSGSPYGPCPLLAASFSLPVPFQNFLRMPEWGRCPPSHCMYAGPEVPARGAMIHPVLFSRLHGGLSAGSVPRVWGTAPGAAGGC